MKVRFQEGHLRSFSAASLDTNPLHLSESYSRKTATGERVVYGILAFLSCLRDISIQVNLMVSAVRIDFKNALVLDVDYTVAVEWEASDNLKILLLDGTSTVMRARIQFRDGNPQMATMPETGVASRAEARRLKSSDFERSLSFRGNYAPPCRPYEELLDLLGIERRAWGDALLLSLLCTSYLTGMEMPGEAGTYTGLRLNLLLSPLETPFAFNIVLDSYHIDFGLIQSQFAFSGTSGIWAKGEISAILRTSDSGQATITTPGSGRLAGKSAIVVGASRGLGAALALKIVAEGGTVIGIYARSDAEAKELVAASRDLPGKLTMERGDASDIDWCANLRERVTEELRGLDLLVCNAAPAIQPLRVEEACYQRIQTYVEKGFALVAAPLTSFMDLLSSSNGTVLMVSSLALDDPPPVWPHYVALKAAAEAFVRTAAAGNPKVAFWITRPGRILTDFTDTPMGRLEAETPQVVARRVLEHVSGPSTPGTVQYCL